MFDKNLYLKTLKTKALGRELVALDIVDSTNTWAAQRLNDPKLNNAIVVTENQTAGRGRLGRNWSSPPGVNLTFSVVWPSTLEVQNISAITLAAGVALCDAIVTLTDLSPALKYPNDLILNGKKAGGILTELRHRGDQNIVIIGMGVNVNTQIAQLPQGLQAISTSIRAEEGNEVSREALLAHIANQMEIWLHAFTNKGPGPVVEEYRRYCAPFMKRGVEVVAGDQTIRGKAIGIDDRGGLLVEVSPDRVKVVYSGETKFFD